MSAGDLKYKIDEIDWYDLLNEINKGIMKAESPETNYQTFRRHSHGVIKQLKESKILKVIGCGLSHYCKDCDRDDYIKNECTYLKEKNK